MDGQRRAPTDCAGEPEAYRRAGLQECMGGHTKTLILTLLLAGCATDQTARLPVPVSCVKAAPEKPASHDEAAILAMSDYAATLTTWTERLQLKAYAEKAEAVINACR